MEDITDLRNLKQWVCWDRRTGRKLPINPQGGAASSTDPTTWGTYDEAVECMNLSGYDGIGFVFREGDGLAGIDLDDCILGDGSYTPIAEEMLERLETYAEVSPSGTGIKFIGTCPFDRKGITKEKIEVYTARRFFTITGDVINYTQLGDISEVVQEYCSEGLKQKCDTPIDWDNEDVSESILGDARAYLETMNPSISGHNGHNALFKACCRMLIDFKLPPKVAYDLIMDVFNPKCDPPWGDDDVIRKIGEVLRKEDIKKHKDYGRMEMPEASVDDIEMSTLNANLIATSQVSKIPDNLLKLPQGSGMAEFAEYIESQSSRSNRALAVTGAISWYSACLGRGVMDESGTKTNLYTVVLAPSSGGKQAPQDCIRAVFDRSSNPNKVAGKVTSDAAIGSLLSDTPSLLCLWDEYGLFLQKAKGGVMATINDTLLDLWGAANSRYRLKAYADKERDIIINQPCFSFSGYSTADHFWSALTRMQLRDGFAGRIMVVDTGKRGERKNRKFMYPPQRLVDRTNFWINRFTTFGSTIGIEDDPDAEIIPVSAEAERAYDELWDVVEGYTTDEEQAIWGRAPEKARKLALMRALDRSPDSWKVTEADARWGIDWAIHTSEYVLTEGRKRLGIGGSFEAVKMEVFSIIKDAKGTIGKTALLKQIGCDNKLYQSVIGTLIESGRLEEKIIDRKKVLFLNA